MLSTPNAIQVLYRMAQPLFVGEREMPGYSREVAGFGRRYTEDRKIQRRSNLISPLGSDSLTFSRGKYVDLLN